MDFDLTGKTALVTGASSGLGNRMAQVLSLAGADVVVAARRKERLDALIEELRENGGKAWAVTMDVTDVDSIRNAFAKAESEAGIIDVLVNNAGIAQDCWAIKMDVGDFDQIFDTNVRGVYFVAQEFARRFVGRGESIAQEQKASVINISSASALRAVPKLSAYAASKAAVIQLTKTLAVEWSTRNIRVNCILPGYIETEINEELVHSEGGNALKKRFLHKRFGHPKDLDGALLLLASDASDFITGSELLVDDGQSLAL